MANGAGENILNFYMAGRGNIEGRVAGKIFLKAKKKLA